MESQWTQELEGREILKAAGLHSPTVSLIFGTLLFEIRAFTLQPFTPVHTFTDTY